ncbi:MAG TPA: acetate/propionate family kinase [Puia sp.]|jgi:acetate kinase|nr:acetate/propionate family kinase [Puia sp.]
MNEQKRYILALNGGSSSLKFGLYEDNTCWMEAEGQVDKIGSANGHFKVRDAKGEILKDHEGSYPDTKEALRELIGWLKNQMDRYPLAAIGHRLVQGGPDHREPEIIDEKLISALEQWVHLAPNHLPASLDIIKNCRDVFPGTPQIACFDTAFHRDMPACAVHFAIPRPLWKEGIIRYGFHGLSYEYIMQQLERLTFAGRKEKIIIAHLGNGCSMTAIHHGVSIDTTMGLTPTGGLVMGTRSGDLDPGLIFFLLRQEGLTVDDLENVIDKRSGLEALSGNGHDVQILLEREASDPNAAEALTLFCYQAKKFIGALAAALGGLDTLVFTGGIGENSPVIRRRITDGLQFLGINLDEKHNKEQEEIISTLNSPVMVCAIKTNEERMIASHTRDLITK